MNNAKSNADDTNGGARGNSHDSELHRLAREWALVATEQLRLAQALQERAAEERSRAIQFEQQGDFAQAAESRSRENSLLREAEANLRKAQAALQEESKLEGQDDLSIQAAELQIRLHMPDILPVCWSLAYAVRGSKEIDAVVKDTILRLYEAFAAGLMSIREDRSMPRILEQLRSFVRATRNLEVPDVAIVWEHHKGTLESFL